jgi:hypothetical protein
MLLDAISEIIAALPSPAPPNYIGLEYLNQEDAPPRIVWDPKDELGRGPMKGGRMVTGSPPVPVAPFARSLRTRVCKVDVHLWAAGIVQSPPVFGADWIAVEELLQTFIQTVHATSVGFYDLVGGQWDRMKEFIRLGRVYTAFMEFRIPVADVAPTNATIAEYTLTETMG